MATIGEIPHFDERNLIRWNEGNPLFDLVENSFNFGFSNSEMMKRLLPNLFTWICFIVLVASHHMASAQRSSRVQIDSFIQMLDTATSEKVKINVHRKLVKLYSRLDIDSARLYCRELESLVASSDDELSRALGYHQIGSFHYYLGNHDSVLLYSNMAKEHYIALNRPKDVASALINIGLSYQGKGHLAEALEALNTALHITDTSNLNFLKNNARLNLSLVYRGLHQKQEEIEVLEAIINDQELGTENPLYAIACNNLSIIHRHDGDIQKSNELLRRALRISEKIDLPTQISRSYSNLGANYTKDNKLDSAELFLKKAIDFNIPRKNNGGLVKNYWHLGELYVKQKKYAAAKIETLKSLDVARAMSSLTDYAYAYEQLADIERLRGRHTAAYAYIDTLHFWRDSMAQLRLEDEIADSETRYKTATLALENEKKGQEIENLVQSKKITNLLFLLGALITLFGIIFFVLRSKQVQIQKLAAIEEAYAQSNVKQLEEIKRTWAEQLHDDVGQDLVFAKQALESEGASEESQKSVNAAIDKIRSISQQEYPHLLKFIGLKGTIEKLIDEIEQSSPLIISESIDTVGHHLAPEQAIHLYRILQELLKNTLKHGSAASTSLVLKKHPKKIEVRYEDNGAAFSFQENLANGHSLGLKQISDRFKILNTEVRQLPNGKGNNVYHFFIDLKD